MQTLFYECIAEMKKALVRMENVAADTTEESESMVNCLAVYFTLWNSIMWHLGDAVLALRLT